MGAVGFRNGIMVPDHQAAVVVGADKVLAAIVIAVDRALVNAVRDGEFGDEVVIRVQHAEAVVQTGHEHVAVPVLGDAQVRVAQQLRRTGDRGSVSAQFRIPEMDALAVQIFPAGDGFVEDGDSEFPALGAVVVHVVGAEPFTVLAVNRHAVDVVRVDGTVGNGECLPDAIQVFAGAQGALAQGQSAERAAAEPDGVGGVGGYAGDLGKADGIGQVMLPVKIAGGGAFPL